MAVQRSSVVEMYVSSLTQALSDAAEEAASLAAFNKRKNLLAAKGKDKGKRVAAAEEDDSDALSVPSRDTLVKEASRVLAFVPTHALTGADGAAVDAAAVVSSSVEERGAALKPFGSFDEFIANSTQYLRARGLPANSYSMNGIVRTDIDLSR